ncbi:MAG: signal peptidase I [Alphaproteobacteria bacterium]|nr:signal peptidase I [Alphaproteobacteria bacterium]
MKKIFKSNTFSLIMAIFAALLLRSFLFEPFHIPSGSMEPTLLTGDYLFVTKYSYGWSRYSFPFGIVPIKERVWNKAPERGDIVVFKLPTDTSVNYIKRIIGMPGDKIQVIGGLLYINNKAVPRVAKGKTESIYNGQKNSFSLYEEELPGGKKHLIQEVSDSEIADNTPPFFVPKDHYFMMGDNRDNSRDSRYEDVTFVPKENILGPAGILFYSNGAPSSILAFWQWGDWLKGLRFSRFFKKVE